MPVQVPFPSAVPFDTLFQSDWNKAQARYQAALNAGIDQKDSAAIYLQPIDEKWKIIKANEENFQDPAALTAINNDFDEAIASASKNLSLGQPVKDTMVKQLGNLGKWQMAQAKPSLDAAQLLELRNLNSEMNRLKREKTYYDRFLRTRISANDPLKDQKISDANAASEKLASMLEDTRAEYDAIKSGGANKAPETSAASALAGTTFPIAAASPKPGIAEILAGTGSPDIQLPAQEPFQLPQVQSNPPVSAAAALTKKPLIFISGRPDLSNVTREEADASWIAKQRGGVPFGQVSVTKPAPAAKPPTYNSAADVRADYKAGKLSRDDAVAILQDQFGLE